MWILVVPPEVEFHLTVAGAQENITVSSGPQLVHTKTSTVSTLIDERAIGDLPLNGRRFSDLMLLSPGVTQDPRSLTSAANGDLSFGGLRGFQNGDPNQDGNDLNDRLPGYSRNAFTGPDYSYTDLRLVRKIHISHGDRIEFTADSFNLFSRDNQRVTIPSNGLTAEATTLTQYSTYVNGVPYPAYHQQPQNFMKPNAAFAPRQIQLGLKFIF